MLTISVECLRGYGNAIKWGAHFSYIQGMLKKNAFRLEICEIVIFLKTRPSVISYRKIRMIRHWSKVRMSWLQKHIKTTRGGNWETQNKNSQTAADVC